MSELGHNNPPKTAMDWLIEDLARETAGYKQELDDRLAELPHVTVYDDETASMATTLGGIFLGLEKELEAKRLKTNKPFNENIKAINAHYGTMIEPATAAKKKLEAIVNAYRVKKRAEEDAERRAAEEEARALVEQARKADTLEKSIQLSLMADQAQAAALKTSNIIRSDYGAVATGRKEWKSEIEDWSLAYQQVRDNSAVQEAISKAIQARVRSGDRNIPGVRVFEVEKTQFRT
jgi:hypothetical protein